MTSITSNPVAGATVQAPTGRGKLTGDMDMFLKLLVTQARNQDPLSPMDTAQYTQQLATYSQVEQSITTNEKLDRVIGALTARGLADSAALVGRHAEVPGLTQVATGDGVHWTLLDAGGAQRWSVVDELGRKLAEGALAADQRTVSWDGAGIAAGRAITLRLVDGQGDPVPSARASFSGQVAGVVLSGSDAAVEVQGQTIPVSQIRKLS